jgi:hypothetical protein
MDALSPQNRMVQKRSAVDAGACCRCIGYKSESEAMQQKGVMQQPAGAFSSPVLVGLILLALGQHGCAQQQLPRQEFTVDLDAADTHPFDNAAVTRCFGSSHAATAMRADWQRELTQVQQDLKPEFVRFHGVRRSSAGSAF